MTYASEEKLIAMTLDALERVAARASKEVVPKDRSIAVCLAFLATRRRVERWPFDEFWQALACSEQKLRSANTHRCLNGIYAQLKIDRSNKAISKYR